jgi:recombinational DNA repair ATPase RecF
VDFLKANDHIFEHVGRLFQSEDSIRKFILILKEVTFVAILENHVNVIIVDEVLVKFDDIRRVHSLEKANLSIYKVFFTLISLKRIEGNYLQSVLLFVFVLDKEHLTESSLP